MKKMFVLCLMLFATLVTGCLTDNNDNEDNEGNDTASEYLPLKIGASYSFKNTYDADYTLDSDYKSNTDTCIYTTASHGDKTYLSITDFPLINDLLYWFNPTYTRIADNKLYAIIPPINPFGFSYTYQTTTDAPEVPLIDFGADTWTVYHDSASNEYGGTEVLITGAFIGHETITVPAGTFVDCLTYELTITTHDLNTDKLEFQVTIKLWCAKSIGWIKTYSTTNYYHYDDTNTPYVYDKIAMTSELKFCSIP